MELAFSSTVAEFRHYWLLYSTGTNAGTPRNANTVDRRIGKGHAFDGFILH